jgi:lysophospholipase L1-like esterase
MGTAYFDVEEGQDYRVYVYSTSAILSNNAVIYFWDKNNRLIPTSTYIFTVFDANNKIIDITAPTGAVQATITYLNDKTYYAYKKGGIWAYDWLLVKKENLSKELNDKIFETPIKLKYSHSLNKPFNFNGKTVTFFGDSITAGTTSPNLGSTNNPYGKVFADKFSMNYASQAVGGSYICDTVNATSILNKVINYTDIRDFIFIAGGTNDWTNGKPLGVLGDTTGDTFYGALHVMCESLKTNHPTSTIIFITPINQNVSRPNSITTMDAYRNAIFEVATSYGFNIVDGSKIGFPTEQGVFANTMCQDGVHPTELGHSFYGKSLCGILA